MTAGLLAAWYSEPGVDLYQGDTRAVMAQMPAESVDVCIFSPPFFGLRKYDGVQELVWGGKDGCEHEWQETNHQDTRGLAGSTLVGTPPGPERRQNYSHSTCALCGAWRGAWGLEPSVEMWVAHTLEVMRAVKRVLKPSGVCFVEVGDSYWSDTLSRKDPVEAMWGNRPASNLNAGRGNIPKINQRGGLGQRPPGLKPKDLCLVPERLVLALQADGWWVRSRIVWAKPNPMPESVIDRPTKSHSTIWMLTKAADYYFDQEAVREPTEKLDRPRQGGKGKIEQGVRSIMPNKYYHPSGRNLRDVWTLPTQPFSYELCQSCGQIYTAAQFGRLPIVQHGRHHAELVSGASTQEARELNQKACRCGASDFLSHFAVFPEALPTRCILASTSEAGCCPKCGKPWERQMKREAMKIARSGRAERAGTRTMASGTMVEPAQAQTLGWAPTCSCGLPQAENVPAVVLDVCSGSGTTVLAAKKLGRKGLGIDLSEKYLALAQRRLSEVPLSLGGIT